MKRASWAAALIVAAMLGAGCSSETGKAQRILIVTVDTLRWDRLGYTGYDVETPNLDALAESGTTFTDVVTVAPLTLPAHSSLFTSLNPPGHGVRSNGIFRLDEDLETMAEVLQSAGYETGAFVGAFVLERRFGLAQGFDVYDDELPDENPVSTAYFAERPAEEVVHRALEWIESRGDEPFFAWVHVFDPHAPYDAPAPYGERYASRPYDGEIAYTDHALGPLLDAVRDMDDSLVVVTSDHGESLGEHGEQTHGLFVYEATTRVPLVMNGVGIESGRRYDARVRTIDVAPTVLELAGLSLPGPVDGRSLVGVLADGAETETPDAYSESFLPRYSFNWSELTALRRGELKVIQAPRPELFDLEADPEEQSNVWDSDRALEARTMVAELTRMAENARPTAEPLDVDPETARRLESLGYIAGGSSASRDDDRERVDPKDRVEVYESMQELLSPDLAPEEIVARYRDILEIEPTNTAARNRLANTLSELGRYDEAIEEYRRLVRDSEIDFRGLENLSAALLLRSRTEEALSTTEMAVASAPWNPDFYVLRGEALEQARRIDEARDAYARADELAPMAESAWRLGAVQEKLGDAEAAEGSFRAALERDPAFEPAVASLARLLSQQGRVDDAYALLESAPEGLDRGSAGLVTATAEAHLAAGRRDQARVLLERARSEYPDNTRVLALLGAVFAQDGDDARAIQTLGDAVERGESSPDVLRNLALVLMRNGRVPEGVSLLERARDESPSSPSVWFSLGNAYFRAGAVDRAVEAFERAAELRSPWPEATFNLAMASQRAGQTEKAADAFREFLRIASAADEARRDEAEKRLRALSGGS